jgi:hypothetical protein
MILVVVVVLLLVVAQRELLCLLVVRGVLDSSSMKQFFSLTNTSVLKHI